MKTILDILDDRAAEFPKKIVFNYIESNHCVTPISYEHVHRHSISLAAKLQSLNARGERALILLPSSIEFVYAMFGCFYAGIIAVPAYPPLNEEMSQRIASFIVDADIKYLITNKEIAKKLKLSSLLAPITSIMNKLPSRNMRSNVKMIQAATLAAKLQIILVDEIGDSMLDEYKRIITKNDIAYLQYTSGSVAKPKGVVVTHANLIANLKIVRDGFKIGKDEVFVSWLPLYHDMGLISTIFTPVFLSAQAICMSPFMFLTKPFRWLEAASTHEATITGAPDFAYRLCTKKITEQEKEKLDLSTLNVVFSGAEKVRKQTFEDFYHAFAGCRLRNNVFFPCYGLAEATLYVSGKKGSVDEIHKQFDYKKSTDTSICHQVKVSEQGKSIVSVGGVVCDTTLVIINPADKSILSEDMIGEICVSGDSVTPYYWNNHRASEETFIRLSHVKNDTIFVRTGDIGFIHHDELYIVGRLKELIIISGVNHYPADIEDDLEKHVNALRSGSVVAFSVDKDDCEKLVIVAEIKDDKNVVPDDVINEMRDILSRYHQLSADDIVLVKSKTIPKTSSGKLKRNRCRLNYINHVLYEIASLKKSA